MRLSNDYPGRVLNAQDSCETSGWAETVRQRALAGLKLPKRLGKARGWH